MTVHKEGYQTIALCGLFFVIINIVLFYFLPYSVSWLAWIIFILSFFFFLFIISFFRVPKRVLTIDETKIVAPADGKVVVIEETVDEEYFKDKRLQISIFMSPANVHQNLNPVSGEVVYSQYHKGKYLVAWDPKSSTHNERHTVVIQNGNAPVLVKQIAGAVARRIVNYLKPGQKVQQGAEMGFIKFGSRVDVLLPPAAKIHVQLKQVVKGGITVLASW
ncbi:phosphatidylserine decarboxylase family protein [Agriterribacter sp.]|uniref:phosphatidylserine decarboxylase family protein n=1 Tax=Agriterribacter sp. TaxID=2821509 RepID=UPI002C892A12|nr:phosphatidylserine decarboxylase family protein [Agriterribacter sp.]HRO48381.1 phosphatidylserine decarboxylase family protein [Agriterribacter sp.]HRQ19257.1 phosphatidylserine decarboxylase family protein [Agriterribacter sp.]